MIMKEIRIFSQNICKNNLLTKILLEAQRGFDIIFIQELLWLFICSTTSSLNREGEELVGVPNYPNWIIFNSLYKKTSLIIEIFLVSFSLTVVPFIF